MKRLLDNHPTKQKVDALYDFAESLGLRLEFMGVSTLVTDLATDQTYYLRDVDDGEAVCCWPPATEYKLNTVE